MDNLDLFTENLLLRNLSKSTIKSYCSQILLVSKNLKKDIDLIDETDLRRLIVSGKARNLSSSTQMSIINAFKAYFKE